MLLTNPGLDSTLESRDNRCQEPDSADPKPDARNSPFPWIHRPLMINPWSCIILSLSSQRSVPNFKFWVSKMPKDGLFPPSLQRQAFEASVCIWPRAVVQWCNKLPNIRIPFYFSQLVASLMGSFGGPIMASPFFLVSQKYSGSFCTKCLLH